MLALECERLSRSSTVDELAPGLPVSEVERAWNEADTQWAVAAGEEPLANSVQSGDALAACRGGGFGLDGPVAPTQPFARRTNLRVVFPEPSNAVDVVAPVSEALAARRARQCLVCRCRHLEPYAWYVQYDGPPVAFCSRRCFRLFEPYIEIIEDAGGVHDESFLGVHYGAMEMMFEEALTEARQGLRAVRVFRGLVQAARALVWLHRRARCRRVLQAAAVHLLYRPGGRVQRWPGRLPVEVPPRHSSVESMQAEPSCCS